MLKRRTTPEDAGDHRLRAAFFADPAFLRTFGVPLGVSVYGSTELGGLSHTHLWRAGDETEPTEGAAHYGGQVRLGFEHRIAADGDIQVRAQVPGLLAEGYVGPGGVVRSFLEDGWFHSGDLGYTDDLGGLVYIARASDSVRVKGEFVPVPFVEEAFRHLPGIGEVAVWKRPSELVDEELVLFMEGEAVPVEEIRQVSAGLPSFMRPAAVARLTALPRDTGVGKIRRRELDLAAAVELVEL
jgi:carnitine-CoA ligase